MDSGWRGEPIAFSMPTAEADHREAFGMVYAEQIRRAGLMARDCGARELTSVPRREQIARDYVRYVPGLQVAAMDEDGEIIGVIPQLFPPATRPRSAVGRKPVWDAQRRAALLIEVEIGILRRPSDSDAAIYSRICRRWPPTLAEGGVAAPRPESLQPRVVVARAEADAAGPRYAAAALALVSYWLRRDWESLSARQKQAVQRAFYGSMVAGGVERSDFLGRLDEALVNQKIPPTK
jgi:hypothetical protein